jgi:predicted nucleic acid-binding protein
MAGASTEAKRRDVERKKRMFASMDRIIYPNESISTKSGKCIQKMKVKSKHMLGDVIIAMTAKQIGATVWTTDKDFERIKESMDFKLRVFKGQ